MIWYKIVILMMKDGQFEGEHSSKKRKRRK